MTQQAHDIARKTLLKVEALILQEVPNYQLLPVVRKGLDILSVVQEVAHAVESIANAVEKSVTVSEPKPTPTPAAEEPAPKKKPAAKAEAAPKTADK